MFLVVVCPGFACFMKALFLFCADDNASNLLVERFEICDFSKFMAPKNERWCCPWAFEKAFFERHKVFMIKIFP